MTHVVVIGLGSIGRRHVANVSSMVPDARITIVRHRLEVDDECRRVGATVVTCLDDVEPPVDLAILATPSANHVERLPELIDRGWPLLIEKPIVTEATDCDAIAARLDEAEAAVRVAGFNLRHLPSLQRMRSVIEDGRIGRPIRASFTAGQWLPDWRPDADYRTVYSANMARGGGVELDLSHEFDMARWFFGDLQLQYARGGRFSDLEITSNDLSIAVLEPAGGRGPLVTVTLDYVTRQRVRTYEVIGDEGRVVWTIDGELELITAEARRSLPTDPGAHDVHETYRRMLEQTLTYNKTGEAADLQLLSDGLASTRLAIDARDRARGLS